MIIYTCFQNLKPIVLTYAFTKQDYYLGSGYSAGPGQIVPRGYSTGPGQIVPIDYLAGPGWIAIMYL